jgi:hypothetical protein
MKEITDPGKKGHKKKTNKNEIHKMPTSTDKRHKPSAWVQEPSMPTSAWNRQGGEEKGIGIGE